MKINNVAAYIRLSNDDGDKLESNSVVNQRDILLRHIQQSSDLELFDIYIDDGYSGTNFERPSFKKMISDIQNQKIDCVLVKDLSRFGRDYIETGRYLERIFPSLGIRFISLNDRIDSLSGAYDMLMPITNIFNEQYSRDISKKVISAMRTKQEMGQFIGAFTCYGYKKDPNNKNRLIPDEPAASIVKRIFNLFIAGNSKNEIARLLNSEGVPSPCEYKRIKNKNYNNGRLILKTHLWGYENIYRILKRQMYCGDMVQHTQEHGFRQKHRALPKHEWTIVENTHEGIITREIWDKAQRICQQNMLGYRSRELNNSNYFCGLVYCGDCGHRMIYQEYKLKNGSIRGSYRCGGFHRYGTSFCSSHSIHKDVLLKIVADDFKKIIKSIDSLDDLITSGIKNFSASDVSSELVFVKKSLAKLNAKKKKIYSDYLDELISKSEYIEFKEKISSQISETTTRIEYLLKKNKMNSPSDLLNTKWVKKFLTIKNGNCLNKEILSALISRIEVFDNGDIKIFYNFKEDIDMMFSYIDNVFVNNA